MDKRFACFLARQNLLSLKLSQTILAFFVDPDLHTDENMNDASIFSVASDLITTFCLSRRVPCVVHTILRSNVLSMVIWPQNQSLLRNVDKAYIATHPLTRMPES